MNSRRREEVEPERICPVGIDNVHRVGIILQPFAHFLSILRENESVYDDVLVGSLAKERHTQYQKRVKPATRLVEAFRYKMRRVSFRARKPTATRLKDIFVFKRIVVLRVRHRARFKPAIKDVWDPN